MHDIVDDFDKVPFESLLIIKDALFLAIHNESALDTKASFRILQAGVMRQILKRASKIEKEKK